VVLTVSFNLALSPCADAQESSFPGGGDPGVWEAVARSVTIYRDIWGVPHIYGPTDASVMFGAAYARTEDRILEEKYSPGFRDSW
jgi:acyl-homoserine lactone acylase PvdQ